MKKTIILSLIIASIILSAILIFDISSSPSTNNEGLRKPDVVVNKISPQSPK